MFWLVFCELQAEILQERAEGCIQVDLQKIFCGFVGVVFGHKFKVV